MLETLRQDLRYATRSLVKSPAFTAVALLCLGLGIGANSTMFSVIDALFLRPPAGVQNPDRVMRLYITRRTGAIRSIEGARFSYPDYTDLRDGARGFEGLAMTQAIHVSFGRGTDAQQVSGLLTTAGYFSVLGVRPALGRFFVNEEDYTPGGHPVVVLSHAFWQRQFASDPGVIGRVITLNGHPFTVIGVAPPSFNGIDLEPVDLWAPMMMQEQLAAFGALELRACACFPMFARLAPGVTAEQAATDASAVLRHAAESVKRLDPNPSVTLGPVNAAMGPRRSRPATVALWLSIVTALVLLIACANVANLLLARAAYRRREIAIRLSLGAGRGRLARQLLTESLVLALLGGAAGLLLAAWGSGLVRLFPLPPTAHVLDPRVLVFTAALSVLTGVVFALVPAWQASRVHLVTSLKDGTSGGGRARSRLRSGLLVSQVALSFVLLIGAGLLVRSLRNVQAIDPGMDLDHLLVVSVNLEKAGFSEAARSALYAQALDRLRTLPGVRGVSAATGVPLQGKSAIGFTIPGRDSLPPVDEGPYVNFVGPEFFETLGIPLRVGRAFTDRDRPGAPPVVVVNETMARLFWPDRSPIGQCMQIRLDSRDPSPPPCSEIVGVVGDTKYGQLREDPIPGYYLPLLQRERVPARSLFVRTGGRAAAMIIPVRRAVQALAPDLPFVNVTPMTDLLSSELLPFRIGALLFTLFGGVALLLAVIGLYGVISYGVAQRTREIGVRMALGAQRAHVLRLVVRQGLALTLTGIVAGVGLAAAGTRLMRGLLYGVTATDPATFAGVGLVLALVAVAASWLPARRAAGVDPVVALHAE